MNNKPYPDYVAYPKNYWTPENWLHAVLLLPLQSDTDRGDIAIFHMITRIWRWNLIPLLLVGLVVCILALSDMRRVRKGPMASQVRDGKKLSA